MFNLFHKKPAAAPQPAAHKQPDFPFDLTGYTCFSIANCPVDTAVKLLEEYQDISAPEGKPEPFQFFLAPLPEDPDWTLIRWPHPGRFYDMMNLTLWLMGYSQLPGAETPLFAALPPAERQAEGRFLARPDYDDEFMEKVLGRWQTWNFAFTVPENNMYWNEPEVFPEDYYLYGHGYSHVGFKLEWLDHLERIPGWGECSILLER